MTTKILSKLTHVFVPKVSSDGSLIGLQAQPYLLLADLHPELVVEVEGKRIFTGMAFVYLTKEYRAKLKRGETEWLKAFNIQLNSVSYTVQLDQLWGSNIKRGVLTGYSDHVLPTLLEIFNTAESGVRANGATGASGNWSAVNLAGFKVGFFKDKTKAKVPQGTFSLWLVDGINYIHEDAANESSVLRRGLVYHPYKLQGWRLSMQALQWITNPGTVQAVVDELTPHVEQGLGRINFDPAFAEESIEMTTSGQYADELINLNPLMLEHPLANWWLSDHRASQIFDTVTTGSPSDIQGFVAIPCEHYGVVIPQGENRFQGEMVGGGRYPQDGPLSSFVAVADRDNDFAAFLAKCEGFQNRILCLEDQVGAKWHSKGMTVIVPREYWPEAWAGLDMVCGSEDIKAHSDWNIPQDIADSKGRERILTIERGYLSAVSWMYRGTLVGVHPDIWKAVGGDYDGDQGYLFPEQVFPQLFAAVLENQQEYAGLENPKLTKTHTFTLDRTARLLDSIEGGKMVGVASNIALILLHTDPARWPELAEEFAVNTYFEMMLAQGYVKNANISDTAKMFRVIGFLIKIGTDGFKTSLAEGMAFWSEVADKWYKVAKELPAYRLVKFNPRKNPFAFRDNKHVPQYAENESTFGVVDTLMKAALVDGVGEFMYRLELPDYLCLGTPTESFKHFAVGPKNEAEQEWVRAIRTTVREEVALRNMTSSCEWVIFKTYFLKPMVDRALSSGEVVQQWERYTEKGEPRWRPAKSQKFPELAGISRERAANLMWYAFHEAGEDKQQRRPMSVAPVCWLFPGEVKDIVANMPGMANYRDEFTLPVVGLHHAGVELNRPYLVKAELREVVRQLDDRPVSEKRTCLVFENGQYCMLPPEAPLLLSARFSVVFRQTGKVTVGDFTRSIPVPDFIKAKVMVG